MILSKAIDFSGVEPNISAKPIATLVIAVLIFAVLVMILFRRASRQTQTFFGIIGTVVIIAIWLYWAIQGT